jgi:hypothetical protein
MYWVVDDFFVNQLTTTNWRKNCHNIAIAEFRVEFRAMAVVKDFDVWLNIFAIRLEEFISKFFAVAACETNE